MHAIRQSSLLRDQIPNETPFVGVSHVDLLLRYLSPRAKLSNPSEFYTSQQTATYRAPTRFLSRIIDCIVSDVVVPRFIG